MAKQFIDDLLETIEHLYEMMEKVESVDIKEWIKFLAEKSERYPSIDDIVGDISPDMFQCMSARTINTELSDKEILEHAKDAMVSEIGEIFGIYQKAKQGHPIDPEHIKEEVGDLLWGIAEFCTANYWELDEIIRMNRRKLEKRYPNGFDPERSRNRKG